MPIPVQCTCGAKFSAPDAAAGRRGKCPKCSAPIVVPQQGASPLANTTALAPRTTAHNFPPPPPPAYPSPRTEVILPHDYPPQPPYVAPVRTVVTQVGPVSPPMRTEPTIACPFCGEPVLQVAKKCKHCHETIDPAMRAIEESQRHAAALAAQAAAAPAQYYAPAAPVVNVTVTNNATSYVDNRRDKRRKDKQGSALVAALLSFLIPGLGQLYRGRLLAGVLWFVCTSLGYAAFIIPGLVLHLLCVVSALLG